MLVDTVAMQEQEAMEAMEVTAEQQEAMAATAPVWELAMEELMAVALEWTATTTRTALDLWLG